MAIPCNACDLPVHEQSVRCPHCGQLTGVPIDPVAQAEVKLAPRATTEREPAVVLGELVGEWLTNAAPLARVEPGAPLPEARVVTRKRDD